jgi:hypothetical protein
MRHSSGMTMVLSGIAILESLELMMAGGDIF